MRREHFFALIAVLLFGAVACGKNPARPNSGVSPFRATSLRLPPAPGGDAGCEGLPLAPESLRVDLYTPEFSNPTQVTNPLFPIGQLDRVILLGKSDGLPFRVETTLLARTEVIRVDGRKVETLVSQYVAWLDGRIHEVALDWYAQDDQGAVWYLGEDVFNYEDGRIADTEGTWRAGRDGPAAMIMPALPQVGDVWRPENVCGVVFEEVTATSTGVTVQGPRGPVTGALVVRELHMDGTFEDKTFAPGYGEFSTGAGNDLEAVALAVPTDALAGPIPAELETLAEGAASIFDTAQEGDWSQASATLAAMTAAWTAFRAGGVPPMLEDQMNTALDALATGVAAEDETKSRQASIEVARANLDFQLRHRPRAEIDLAHLELLARQLVVDGEARDHAGILSDRASIKWIRDRFARPLGPDIEALIAAAEAAALGASQ